MSRHCLYCAKELPKAATNNFCSKNCWTEYKKLKAMDVGTDKQATVLIKRSELQGVQSGVQEKSSDSFEKTEDSQHDPYNSLSDAGVFVDATKNTDSEPSGYDPQSGMQGESDTISSRLGHLESLVRSRLDQASGPDSHRVEEICRLVDDMALRLNKLEIDMEKVDMFLRSVDKFEDRLRRAERQLQSSETATISGKKGFFAKLFS
jgi:hypothetical protein